MGQQISRNSNSIYFHQKIPSFLSSKKQSTTQKPEEPIKFQYKTPKKNVKTHKNKAKRFDNFGLNTINNLKNVIDGVKSECSWLKRCAVSDSNDENLSEAYTLRTLQALKNSGQIFQEPTSEVCFIDKNFETGDSPAASINITSHAIRFKEENSVPRISRSNEKKPKKRTKEYRKEIKSKHIPIRTKSEPNLRNERGRERIRYKRNTRSTNHRDGKIQQFGYEIQDVDEFLAKATLSKPANIPVVLAFPSVLYQTRVGGYQAEISLPLGMVVNAIFKNQNWLYVQTPHAEEGYVSYSACLPLGIIPPQDDDKLSPCWEKSTDVFPKPSGNMTDTEKLSCKSENEDDTYCSRTRYRTALSTCGEKSVDRLYLRAAAIAKGKGTRHTLLVIREDYKAIGKDSLSVLKNEVVFLLNASIKGWFYVKNKEGREGFIPSVIAGHGFL